MRLSTSCRLRACAQLCAFAAVVSFSDVALAQDNQPSPQQIKQAARAFDNAREAYGSEDYETAADQFEKADGHAPSAVALQWAIDSHHQAGHAARAATLAALAKQRHPDQAELVELSDKVIEEVRPELLEVQIVCEAPCELLVDNKIVHGRPASARTLFLDPGEYTIRASFGEERMSQSQNVSGQAEEVSSVLFAPPEPEAKDSGDQASTAGMDDPFADNSADDDPMADTGPKQDASSGWSPAVFWVGAGLTAVTAGVTVWSGLDTQNNPGKDVVREKCRGLGTSCPEYQDGLSKQKRTNVLIGVTGGLAAFTVVAAVLTDWSGNSAASKSSAPSKQVAKARRAETAWSVQPVVSLGNTTFVGAAGRF